MRWCAVIALAACGRVGFGAGHDAPPKSGDAPGDAVAGCPPTALLCDGFESGDISKWSTYFVDPGAAMTVQTAIVHGGRYALDGNVPAIRSGAAAEVQLNFAAISTGMIALREWIYAPDPLVNFDGVISMNGTTPDEYALLNANGSGAWTATEDSTAGIHDHISSTNAVQNAWSCVELDYSLDPPRTVTVYVADALAVMDTTYDPAPVFDHVYAGMARAQASGAHVVVDDVVIARAHIGCQ